MAAPPGGGEPLGGRAAGSVSFAVRTERRVWARDATRVVPAVSVLKVMLLVAYLRRDDVRGRALRPADRALLAPMIRWSDSAAASRVRDIVGNGLVRLARRSGMRNFHPAPIWGDSIVDASDQSGAADHQVALLRRGGRRLSMAIMTTSNPSHAYAEETQRGVAARLLRGLGPSSMPGD